MRKLILLFPAAFLLGGCPNEQVATQDIPTAASTAASDFRPFQGADVRSERLGGDFTLTGHTGLPVSLSDFRGKIVALVFGYAHCPDVCPTHLLTYAQALAQLSPEESAQVQLLFVSIDPIRDRPELLARYVPAFHPDFVGLTSADGSEAGVRAVMERYGATAAKQPPNPNGFYTVDHSSATFLLDRQGRVVVMEPFGQTAVQLAQDLRILLSDSRL